MTVTNRISAVSKHLRAARALRGIGQEELARRSGIQATAISHYETGRRRPSLANLLRLSKALDVSTDYLVGRVGSATAEPRVTLLEDLLRRYRDHHDDLTHEGTGGDDAGCACLLCDEAHKILEVEP